MTFNNAEILEFINSEVPSHQRKLVVKSLESESKTEDYYDNISKIITGEVVGDKSVLNTGSNLNTESFLVKLKKEVYLFICTEDIKYTAERNFIGKNFKEVATIITTAIAATFSLGTGVVVGAITNILISIIKVNKNAWCELYKEKFA